MKRRVYPEHTPTRLESLDGVPKHWSIRKLKHVASVQFSSVDKNTAEGEQPVRLCNYIDVYHNEYISPELEFMEATASPNEIEAFGLKKGDVLVTKDSESWDDIAVPAYVRSDLRGVICGYHLAQVHPDPERVDGEYLFRAFRACAINHQFRIAATGITRYGLGKYWLDNALFPVPPLKEQRVIASFLDRETAKIDALVAKKERLIELLQEKRAAVISQAVTKGLDPDVPMKDSGIEWLGKIPAHWEVKRLKYVTSMNRETLPEETNPDYEMRYVDIGNVNSVGQIVDTEEIRFETAPSRARRKVQKGDTIISTVRTYLKAIAYIEEQSGNLIVSTGFAVLSPAQEVLSKFLWRFVQSTQFVGAVVANSEGVGYPAITPSRLGCLLICIPPVKQQEIIADYLDRESAKIDAFIAKVREGIEKLKEYRTALISAAVTGKIDVRGEISD